MKNLKKLTPFKYFALTNFPYIEADFDALTNYELFCKIVEYVNSISASQNNVIDDFNELKAMVDALAYELHNLDLQEEVNNKLDEMAEDGTLEAIISKYVLYNETIKLNRIGRLLDRFEYDNHNKYLAMQSCFYENGYYYTCGDIVPNTIQSICKWNENGEIVTYKNDYDELGHANDICTYNNYLLIANADADGNISIVNKNTLDFVDVIHFDELSSIYGISQYNDDIIFISYLKTDTDTKFIARLDFENLTYERLFDLPTFTHGTPQGICYYNNYIYLTYVQSNEIIVLNMNGDFIKIFDIPEGDGYYPVGEVETVFYKGNDLYLWTVGSSYINVTITSGANFGNIFKTNILSPNFPTVRYSYAPAFHSIRIAVNGSAEYTFNPEETFTTLEEACAIANYHKSARISVSNISYVGTLTLINGIYEIYGLTGGRNINRIYGNNCKIQLTQCNTNYLIIDNTDIKTRVFSAKIELNATRSYIEMQYADFTNTQTITINRTSFIIRHITGINSSITVNTTEPTSNYLEINTWYIPNLLTLCKSVIGNNTTTYKNLKIDYYLNNSSLVTDRLSNANINSNSAVTNNLTNQEYESITYDTDGKIYHTTSGTSTEFTYSDYIEMKLLYRISST